MPRPTDEIEDPLEDWGDDPVREIADPGGVVIGSRVYKPGQEEELYAVILDGRPYDVWALVQRGILRGHWINDPYDHSRDYPNPLDE